jgi:GntR family transcriptional regulator
MQKLFNAPLYAQIREEIFAALRSGRWSANDPLPSETKLASEFSVSQGTIRKAIDDLVAQNILYRHQGRGTFIRRHDEQQSLFRFFNLSRNDGTKPVPESLNIHCRTRKGLKHECLALQVPTGDRLIEVLRLRRLDGQPVILETILVSQQRFPELNKRDLPNTLYELYSDDYNVHITRAEEQIQATLPDAAVITHLNIGPTTPLLEIRRIAFDLHDQPVELRISQCVTGSFVYACSLN